MPKLFKSLAYGLENGGYDVPFKHRAAVWSWREISVSFTTRTEETDRQSLYIHPIISRRLSGSYRTRRSPHWILDVRGLLRPWPVDVFNRKPGLAAA